MKKVQCFFLSILLCITMLSNCFVLSVDHTDSNTLECSLENTQEDDFYLLNEVNTHDLYTSVSDGEKSFASLPEYDAAIQGIANYNASAAAAYALQYALSYNTSYTSFKGSGGDCANFVSQCLYAGGISQSNTWKPYEKAWIGALSIKRYFVDTLGCTLITSPSASQVAVGDIMWYNEGDHVTIVTSIVDGIPHICGHTYDVRDSANWKQGYSTYAVIKMGGSVTSTECTCSTSYAGTYTCTTSNSPLTIRSGHGTNFTAVGSIPSGATVTVSKGNGIWAHVTYNGISGYASMEYLSKNSTGNNKYPSDKRIYAYTIATSGNVNASTSHGGSWVSYMTATDVQYICEIYDDGWCMVYITPWNGDANDGRYRYTLLSYFLNTSYSPKQMTAIEKTPVYYRNDLASSPGYVCVGDNCTIVDESGDYYQIICPWNDSSYYWLCWVNKSAFVHHHSYITEEFEKAHPHRVYKKCSCGDYEYTGETKATWGTGVITKQPTCTETGIKTYTCTVCSETKTETIPAKGHSFGSAAYDTNHPHAEYKICSTCNSRINTGNTKKVDSCEQCYPVTGISINHSTVTLIVGSSISLSATVSPSNAANKSVTWSSTNDSVAFVSADGVVTGVSAGTVTITAKTISGGKTASCSITVEPMPVPVTGVILSNISSSMSIGDTMTLTATISPTNADDPSVTWSSSAPNIASVNNGVVTAKAVGTSIITVTTNDGGFTDRCTIYVEDPSSDPIVTIETIADTSVVCTGRTFTYSVYLSGTYEGFAFYIPVTENMTVTDVSSGTYVGKSVVNVNKMTDGRWLVSILPGCNQINSEKTLVTTITVSVSEDHPTGTETLSLEDVAISDDLGDPVRKIKSAYDTITITDSIPGDINGDGVFNYFDVSKLYAYFCGKTTIDNTSILDVNGDGTFDYFDVSKLYAVYRGDAVMP